jgi:hypothetical protein
MRRKANTGWNNTLSLPFLWTTNQVATRDSSNDGGVAAGVFGVPGTLEPGAVIVVGSTLGITLTGASKAMLELKALKNTVLDEVGVKDCVVDGVCDDWLGLMKLYDCTPKLGLETSVPKVRLVLLENTVWDGIYDKVLQKRSCRRTKRNRSD